MVKYVDKIKTGWKLPVLPLPVSLTGSNVNGKPNFNTIVWFTMLNSNPPLIGITMSKSHYSNKGIKENKSFSVNIPSDDMVKVTDYCGLFSGAEVDKATIFNVFYGELKTAPMIKEAPFNIECKLVNTIEFEETELFVGEINEVYSKKNYYPKEKSDIEDLNLFVFLMPNGPYLKLGKYLEKAYDVGKDYKPK